MINIEHVHPMLVHFPIVLFLVAVVVDILVLIRKGDLASTQCLPTTGFYALSLAALAATAAAIFGDIALDKAIELDFDRVRLEEHERLAFTTLWVMLGLTGWQFFSRWRGIRLTGTSWFMNLV